MIESREAMKGEMLRQTCSVTIQGELKLLAFQHEGMIVTRIAVVATTNYCRCKLNDSNSITD